MQRFPSDSDIELANHSALRFAGDIEGAWTALISSLSLMPKRFEGGISIQYKNCIRTSRRAGRQDRSTMSAKKWQTKLTVNFPK
jgi:hypothetical protein